MSNRRALWRVEVLRHRAPGMNGEVRALLLELAEHMDYRGYVSVPRRELAASFDVPERRITERLQRARELGLLDTVKRGRPGVTAVYQALLPGSLGASPRTMRGPLGENQDGASPRTIEPAAHGAAGRTINPAQHGASRRHPTGSSGELSPDSEPSPVQAVGLDDESSNPSHHPEPTPTATETGTAPLATPITLTPANQHDEQQRQLRALEQLIQEHAS